jgi:hypothetical protein
MVVSLVHSKKPNPIILIKEADMRIPIAILTIFLGTALTVPAFAQGNAPAQGGAAQGGIDKSGDVKLDVTQFFNEVDTNKDNKISTKEWTAAGLDEALLKFFDQKGEGFFTKDTLANMSHPAALDANKDGKMTLEEVTKFTKSLPKPTASSDAAPAGGAAKK